MRTIAASLVLLVSFVLAGCATGPKFTGPVQPPSGKALIYIYYLRGVLIPKPAQTIFVNGRRIVNMAPGAYYIHEASPGSLFFSDRPTSGAGSDPSTADKNAILELSVQAGRVYYVEQVFVAGLPKGTSSFRPRDEASALSAISDCVQLQPDGPAPVSAASAPEAPPSTAAAAEAAPAMPEAIPVAPEQKHADSLLTRNCRIIAETAEEKSEVDGLVAFLRGEKESRDFDQIAQIEFTSPESVKIGFTWFGGKHSGMLMIARAAGIWKVTREFHAP